MSTSLPRDERAAASSTAVASTSPISAFVVDLLAIAAFALFARVAHQSAEMPLTVGGWFSTAWPFWLGALLAWLGLWFAWAGSATGHELLAGVVVWLCAVVVGLAVWSVRNGSLPHWSFVLVATVVSGALLCGWRLIAPLVRRRSQRN